MKRVWLWGLIVVGLGIGLGALAYAFSQRRASDTPTSVPTLVSAVVALPTPSIVSLPLPIVIAPSATRPSPPSITPIRATATPVITAVPASATPPAPPTAHVLPTEVIAPATSAIAPPYGAATYVFPLQPANVVSYGACHHDYPASDMFAPIGTRFVAPTAGVVEYISAVDPWDSAVDDPATRGGLAVTLVGDDGVRYYGSHLSAVEAGIGPGVRVEVGATLGWTGKSGNARTTPPHLHFGISHPTDANDWRTRRGEINPVPYLADWLNDINTTPDLTITGAGAC